MHSTEQGCGHIVAALFASLWRLAGWRTVWGHTRARETGLPPPWRVKMSDSKLAKAAGIKGGQGRTDEDVAGDGANMVYIALGFIVFVVIAFAVRGC